MKLNINWNRAKDDGINAGFVTLGLLGATFVDRLVQKGVENFAPSLTPYVGHVKAGLSTVGGLVISYTADQQNMRRRMFGYGVTAAGVTSWLRMIPQVDEFLSGVDNKAVSGLNGSNLLGYPIGNFGAEVIRQITTSVAEQQPLDLPDLGNDQATDSNEPLIEPREESLGEFEEIVTEVI